MGNTSSANEPLRSDLFTQISNKLKRQDPDTVKQFGGVYLFCLMNKQNVKYWTMDLNKVAIYSGEPDGEPNATFTLTEDMFEQLAKGKLTPRAAVQAGKCSVNGDIMRAMMLEPFMKL